MNTNIKSQKLVVVLGMHRSGTSAMTRGLTTLGVMLGDRLMAATPNNNDKGFFEDVDFVALNEEMLRACNRKWFSLEPLEPSDVDLLFNHGYIQSAIKLLRNKMGTNNIFCFKDPRTARLLPFWSRVFSLAGLDVYYVVAIRNPLSVSKSLQKRDGLSAELSYFLWINHSLSSLAYTQNRPKIVVDYDQLMESPDIELHRIARWLGITVDQNALDVYQNSFLTKELRHHQFSSDEILTDSTVPKLAKEIFSYLSEQSKNKTEYEQANDEGLVLRWLNELATIRPILRLLDQQTNQIIDQAQDNQNQRKLNNDLSQAIYQRNIEIEALNQLANQVQIELNDLKNGNQTIYVQISELNQENIRRGEWALALKAELEAAHAHQFALINSHSWRVTLPLREIKLWIISPLQQTKRYVSAARRISKKMYQK